MWRHGQLTGLDIPFKLFFEFLAELQAPGIGLNLHKENIDTTMPAGKAIFQMYGPSLEWCVQDRTVNAAADDGPPMACPWLDCRL